MALSLAQKQELVAQVSQLAGQAISVVALECTGLTGADATSMRAQAREQGVHLQVVKNTLAKRAFEGTSFEAMNQAMTGPLMLAFSVNAPSDAARLIKAFTKTNNAVKVKALGLSGQVYGAERLDFVASLPTKDEAIAQLMSVLKAPVAKLVQTVHAVPTKLVRTLDAVREHKQTDA